MKSSRTEVEPTKWTVGELADMVDKKDIVLPRYQRSQVWSDAKKSKFIDSVQSQFPIGSLLVYEPRNNSMKYEIIDGLQRATAFLDYKDNPTQYVHFSTLMEKDDNVIQSFNELYASIVELGIIPRKDTDPRGEFASIIADWLAKVNINSKEFFASSKLARYIAASYTGENNALGPDVREHLEDLIDNSFLISALQDALVIDDYSFPVIKYSGKRANLPDIFERINSNGTQLSKYEIYAATWYSHPNRIRIENELVRQAIRRKYNKVLSDGFQVDELEPSIDDYTLYEYLFGLGRLLAESDKYAMLFKRSSDETSVESVAFSIACIVYGNRLSEIAGLPDLVKSREGVTDRKPIDLSNFEHALFESIDFVIETLAPFIDIKITKSNAIAHTDYQICSLISRALIGRYVIGTWEERPGWKEDRESLKACIPQHYLFDLITNAWGNAGDTRLFNSVWLDASKDMPSPQYTRGFGFDEWNDALNTWFRDDMANLQTKRIVVRPIPRVVLKYAYGKVITASELQSTFDVDHLFPLAKLKDRITLDDSQEEGWPMSSIGNLAFMPKKVNQEYKNDLTLKQFFKKFADDEDVIETVGRYTLLDDPERYGEEVISDRRHFEDFLRMRNDIIKKCIFRSLGIRPEVS